MSETTFAERISVSEVMLAGVNSHKDEFIEKGYISEKYLTDFENLLRSTIALNNKQEKAKSELVDTTDQLYQNLDELRGRRQTFKRIVMNHVSKTQWKEFGMMYRPRGPKSKTNPIDNQDEESQIDDSQDDLFQPLQTQPVVSDVEEKKENQENTTPEVSAE